MPSLSVATVALSALLVGAFYQYVIYPYFLSPLSKIPNAHFTSPITSLWISRRRKAQREIKTIYELHQQHGTVVQLGPNELSVNSIDGLRTIYTGGFEKTAWYSDVFVNFDTDNMVSTRNYRPHSVQKRMLSNVYSKSYLQNSRDLQTVSSIVLLDRFIPLLKTLAQTRQAVNVLPLTQGVGQDFTSAYLFGSAYGTDFVHNLAERDHWLELYEKFKVSHPRERAFGEFEQWCLAMCDKVSLDLKEGKAGRDGTQPVVYGQFYRSVEKSPDDWQSKRLRIASEMLDHLIAGHETSGITFTYIMWELSRRPELQARLRQELLSLSPTLQYPSPSKQRGDPNALPSSQTVDNLPLLDSIIRETLRLHSAVPGPQPRVVPDSSTPTTIEGYANIPAGTHVSCSAYSLHRIADIYPRPDEWLPERWLDPTEEMRRTFWAFGSGGRMCMGSNFALQEIKLVTAAIYTNFTTVIVDDEGIEQEDNYIAPPKGHRLILEFREVV